MRKKEVVGGKRSVMVVVVVVGEASTLHSPLPAPALEGAGLIAEYVLTELDFVQVQKIGYLPAYLVGGMWVAECLFSTELYPSASPVLQEGHQD